MASFMWRLSVLRSEDDHIAITRDPHLRLKLGNDLYDCTLSVVTESSEREGVLQARAKKYAQRYSPPGQGFTVYHLIFS